MTLFIDTSGTASLEVSGEVFVLPGVIRYTAGGGTVVLTGFSKALFDAADEIL